MTDASLTTQWAVCGIAAAAARFVPVPLLDDVIRSRATQLAVTRTLQAHGRPSSDDLQPLWSDADARGSALGRRVRRATTKLLLFPVRKYTAVFGAVRGVPSDVARVVLLARTVDRTLDRGGLTRTDGLAAEALAVRRAVDEAIEGLDLRLVTAALGDGLSRTRGLSGAAVAFARRRLGRGGTEVELSPGDPVAEGAQRVTEALRRPEVAQLFDRFDAQVDRRLPG